MSQADIERFVTTLNTDAVAGGKTTASDVISDVSSSINSAAKDTAFAVKTGIDDAGNVIDNIVSTNIFIA